MHIAPRIKTTAAKRNTPMTIKAFLVDSETVKIEPKFNQNELKLVCVGFKPMWGCGCSTSVGHRPYNQEVKSLKSATYWEFFISIAMQGLAVLFKISKFWPLYSLALSFEFYLTLTIRGVGGRWRQRWWSSCKARARNSGCMVFAAEIAITANKQACLLYFRKIDILCFL